MMRHVAVEYRHVVEIVRHLRLEGARIEAGVELERIVGVDDHGVIDVLDLAQPIKREGAVIGEIPPGLVDHRALRSYAR